MFEPTFIPLFGFLILAFFVLFIFFALGMMLFWLWMFIDCLQRDFGSVDPNTKLLWILVILFAGALGALIYFIMVKKHFQKPAALSIDKTY